MAVRGDEVASSIEAHVREAIERMVGEIRSSVDDVRVAVDSQLKAALQSVQADVNSITFLPQITKALAQLEENITTDAHAAAAASAPAAAAPATTGGDTSRLKRAVQAVERGKTQVDILNALLEQSLEFGSRAALLILKGETFSGWKGVGFSAHGGNDEIVKRFNAAPGLIPELDRVLRDEAVVTWDGDNVSSRLGVGGAVRAVLVPMVIKDKVAAAVFVDATADDVAKLDTAAIELLVFTTGLLVDTLAIRKKVPSPSLSGADAEVASAPRPAVTAAPAPAPAPTAAPAPAPQPAPAAAAADEMNATVSMTPAMMREVLQGTRPNFNIPGAEEFSTAGGTPQSAKATTPSAPPVIAPPPAAAPPAAAPASTGLGGGDDRPSTQYVPPSGVGRGGALGGANQSEDTKKHDEARRFARLLVSEIKLYNEPKVDAGRRNRDLYDRLKEDIDRSRQMYDERIAEDVRKQSNYFYDELVRILADGDANALGL
jgi:hypothetical protein